MGLGVVEDHKLPHVPGTVLLDDENTQVEEITGALKHGTGRNSHIVLSPQPSEDPNDPLNWSAWKKEVIIIILCFGAMLNAGTNVSFHNRYSGSVCLLASGTVPQCFILRDRTRSEHGHIPGRSCLRLQSARCWLFWTVHLRSEPKVWQTARLSCVNSLRHHWNCHW
ncbi:hypothetical protein M8818_004813 [Zalaria obscura]|uniref:Uncharacterized protein n=1 Tax=Zalaria obscura TaxID=2024903 RepID=A0ACC3SB97_9PEZI